MKLVFESLSEKKRISEVVTNASSISNSQSLMALVKDGVVEGTEPEPTPEKKTKDTASAVPTQEPMKDLIERAQAMGVRVTSEDSRAGILQKIRAVELENAGKGEEKASKKAPEKDETKGEEKKDASSEDKSPRKKRTRATKE